LQKTKNDAAVYVGPTAGRSASVNASATKAELSDYV
jgi:hypothetical protein